MPEEAHPGEVVIPLAEETATVSKREVETGRVRVALTTDIETVVARETLRGRKVEGERVPVNQTLADGEPPPQSREEGDTLVIPVIEEVALMVKHLVVRGITTALRHDRDALQEAVSVRRQRATIDRAVQDTNDASVLTGKDSP